MFWRSRSKVKLRAEIVVGRRYAMPNQKLDPWGIKNRLVMTVTDIQGDWVRYRINDLPSDDVMTLDEFASLYEPI